MILITGASGSVGRAVLEEVRKTGDVEWVSARRHAGENVGDTPMEFVAVVLKSLAAAAGAPAHGRTTPH